MSITQLSLPRPTPQIEANTLTLDQLIQRLDALMATVSGIPVTPDSAMQAPTVQAIVQAVAGSISTLPIHVMQKTVKNDRTRKEQLPNHPVARLLSAPNDTQDRVTYWLDATSWLLRYGNHYAPKARGLTGPIRRLVGLPPSDVTVEQQDDRSLMYRIGTEPLRTAAQMHHVRGPARNGYLGDSPVMDVREAIALEIAAERFGASFFANGATPFLVFRYAVGSQGHKSAAGRQQFLDEFQRAYGGRGAFKGLLLPTGMEMPTPVDVENDKAQFLETRKLQRAIIAGAFGVPPHRVGDLERATFCLPAGEMVLTERGPVPIESVVVGQRVWSHGPRGMELADVQAASCTGTDPVLTLRTTNRTLRCNAKHPILARRRRVVRRIGATIGGAWEDGAPHSVEWATEYVPAGDLRVGDTIVTLERLPDGGSLEACPTRLPTIGFMEFCGLLLGDGNTRDAPRSSYVSIARAAHASYMDYYREVMRAEFQARGDRPVHLQEGARQTRFSSARAARELIALGFSGTAHTKRVPGWVFQLPLTHQLAFLRGFLDADGSCDKKGRLSFSSCNHTLLSQIRHLCIGAGVPVTNLRTQRGMTTLPNGRRIAFTQHGFTCSDPGANRRIGSRTPQYVARMEAGAPFFRKARAYPRYGGGQFAEPGLGLARIVSITVGEAEPVYDLTVEGNHSFVAEGVIVHNSNIEHSDLEWVKYVVLRYVRMFEAAMERDLLTPEDRSAGIIIRFNMDGMLRGDFPTRQAGLKTQREMGVINANDWLEHEGMNPREDPGGELYWDQGPSGQGSEPESKPESEPAGNGNGRMARRWT